MRYFINILLLLSSCLLLACSGEDDSNRSSAEKGHVWKEQTDTIDKAREVEGMLMDSAEKTRKALGQQSE